LPSENRAIIPSRAESSPRRSSIGKSHRPSSSPAAAEPATLPSAPSGPCQHLQCLSFEVYFPGLTPFPEQLVRFRDAAPSADLYSIRATLYYLLTGHEVYDFTGRLEQKLLKILQDSPVPILERRADLPGRLASIVDRGLAGEPQDRFPDAASMQEALAPFLGHRP
jgi:hypothetical protein